MFSFVRSGGVYFTVGDIDWASNDGSLYSATTTNTIRGARTIYFASVKSNVDASYASYRYSARPFRCLAI